MNKISGQFVYNDLSQNFISIDDAGLVNGSVLSWSMNCMECTPKNQKLSLSNHVDLNQELPFIPDVKDIESGADFVFL